MLSNDAYAARCGIVPNCTYGTCQIAEAQHSDEKTQALRVCQRLCGVGIGAVTLRLYGDGLGAFGRQRLFPMVLAVGQIQHVIEPVRAQQACADL